MEIGINRNISNEDYHSDNDFLSSSNYKQLLKDRESFYCQKILGEKKQQSSSSSLIEGSYTHSLILEPHMVDKEYIIYPEFSKKTPGFKAFKDENSDKIILSKSQKQKCDKYYEAYLKNPVAQRLIDGGEAELSICHNYYGVPTKIRTDYINFDKGYIVDVKTSRDPVDAESFKYTMDLWGYRLSAALYLAIAEKEFNKKFSFYFICIDKIQYNCEVLKLSKESRMEGVKECRQAIKIYNSCMKSGDWKNPRIEPIVHDKNYEILEV